ncbi:C3a anaphylatoxin chemotactic receptor-like [Lithobates pipiens]
MYSESSYELAYTITKVTTISCYIFTFVVGVIGNGLVIWITGCRMKTVSAVWFLNLAIADFLCCISLPVRIAEWLLLDHNNVRLPIVYFNVSMLHINSFTSVAFLTVISIDRFVTIFWPIWAKTHKTRGLAITASVVLWILCFALVVLQIYIFPNEIHTFFAAVPEHEDLKVYEVRNHEVPSYGSFKKYFMISRSLVMFALPFAVILICYGLIIYKLHTGKYKRPQAFHRTFKIIAAAVGGFFGCWFPYNVWPFIAKRTNIRHLHLDLTMSSLCICLVTVSCCLNPILYALLSKKRSQDSRTSIKIRMQNAMSDFK